MKKINNKISDTVSEKLEQWADMKTKKLRKFPELLIGRGSQTWTDTPRGNKILSLARLPVPPYPHQNHEE